MKIQVEEINKCVVKPCFNIDKLDDRPVLGADLFPEVYANIFLCARKKSGKTMTTFNILKKCASKETTIIVFSSTWEKDPVFETMRAYFTKKDIPIIGFESLIDDETGQDMLGAMLNSSPEPDAEIESTNRRSKYKSPEFIVVFDDLSEELKTRSLLSYIKKNRHYKSKFIISSQYYKDILPQTRKQIDYILVFKGMSDELLREIYKDAELDMSFDCFKEIYEYATAEKYHFLYIDKSDMKLRKDFNISINIVGEEK